MLLERKQGTSKHIYEMALDKGKLKTTYYVYGFEAKTHNRQGKFVLFRINFILLFSSVEQLNPKGLQVKYDHFEEIPIDQSIKDHFRQ